MNLISVNNGNTYHNPADIPDEIALHWDSIIAAMDGDIMESVNCATDADTDTTEGKVQYLMEYLAEAGEDMVIG